VVEVGSKLVINPGSVGQPRDGDPRASYAIIQDYNVELKRVEYPVEETVSVIAASSLSDQDKEMLAEVFRRGQSPVYNGQTEPEAREQRSEVRDQQPEDEAQPKGSD
jgi:hypothetical protein